jgi:alpha-beta hydrolase superfamily lysophospholipase
LGELRAADGTALHWRAWPAEDSERAGVVGLLHGGAEHVERYPELVSALNDAGFDVYALDLRGHGRSGGTPGHVNRFAEFDSDLGRFFDVVREESGEGRPFVIGYSLA